MSPPPHRRLVLEESSEDLEAVNLIGGGDQTCSIPPRESPDFDSPIDALDTSPVTPAELNGWYYFAWAAEGYSALATSVFFPIILQTLAATCGVKADDPTTPCDLTQERYECVVQLGPTLSVSTTSFVFYSTTLSVLIQFFLFLSLGALADYGNRRKGFMLFFAYLTAALGLMVLFVTRPSMYIFATVIFILSNVCYGASFVFYYAWVPVLTRFHPEVIEARENVTTLCLDKEDYYRVSEKVANSISSKGFGYGYLAAVILLFIGSGIAIGFGNGERFGLTSTYGLQIGIGVTCLWMAVFLIFTARQMKPRPGPPLPSGENYLLFSFKKVYQTFKHAKELKELFKFLLGWFIYSDGFSTIAAVAILFFQTELGVSQTMLLAASIVAPLSAGIGAMIWLKIQQSFSLSTKRVLMIQCCLYCVLPLWGLLGFLTPPGTFGIRSQWEIFPLAAYHGFLLGATQSSCRVLFSELLPTGKEAEFFSLYEITDKGSAWIGPLVVGAIGDVTGDKRYSFWFLLILLILPLCLFSMIDVGKGKQDAKAFRDDDDLAAVPPLGSKRTLGDVL